ncbi:integrator complex [Phytophthora cinnamomi]|uniref:integrator complex n=1 Tax=Phytophthora cinnamomi TaxID=4785 RepID=UPI0035594A77|nr:integrator complex [Phytophthora cinnamomi]
MERVEDGSSMNMVPPMFHAGISNKFTKRHVGNFRDTTLTAASAAKQRAERKLERQADAIEKQQQKIDSEKPCPVRLSPVVIPSVRTETIDSSPSEVGVEEDTSALEKEERLRRQEELKQKLQVRRNQEKRQQEYELKLKREAENEASERKLMEREEKAVRLQLKILRRRSKEGKTRQVTADQRREERERLAMAREERHVRLHIKFCARQQNKKRQHLAAASSESESQPPSSSSSRREGHMRKKSSATKSRKTTTGSKKGDASSDDDGDMSFLDIDFTIPASMKSRKQAGNNASSFQLKKLVSTTQTPALKKKKNGLAGAKSKRSGVTTNKARGRGPSPLPAQTQPVGHDDDCGYGDEFDDVVDEAALSHLIC